MNKRDALIIALKTISGFSDIIADGTDFSEYPVSDQQKIIKEIDYVCKGLKDRASRLINLQK